MLKNVLVRGQYFYHLLQFHHNEVLQHNCLSEDQKIKLRIKAIYHNSKAVELGARFL